MERLIPYCLAVFFAGLICVPCGLRADIAPLQVSGGAAALKSPHQTIRMASEEVTIRLEKGTYTVDAVFHFSNSGEAATEWVGFPRSGKAFQPESGDRPDFIRFHAWVDGKAAPFSKEDERWLARQVTFPGNATTTIRVVYEANYYRGRYAEYIIGTGSHWKDTIGRAAFTVDGSAIGGSKHFTAHLKAPRIDKLLTEESVRFELPDYKPEPAAVLNVQLNLPRGGNPR